MVLLSNIDERVYVTGKYLERRIITTIITMPINVMKIIRY